MTTRQMEEISTNVETGILSEEVFNGHVSQFSGAERVTAKKENCMGSFSGATNADENE